VPDLCQRIADLAWQVWTIWLDERTITYEFSTAVGVPIPSLATIKSITYRTSKNQFHSVSFQKLWSAETRISDGTWYEDRSGVLSIPPGEEIPV
jgi:hypothetical protein